MTGLFAWISQTALFRTYFNVSRDKAYFMLIAQTCDRGADLGPLETEQVRAIPDGSGFLFHLSEGKTLKGEEMNYFALMKSDNVEFCPVMELRGVQRSLGFPLEGGFLFGPSHSPQIIYKINQLFQEQ